MENTLQSKVIDDVILWINDNLELKLSLDIITQKSGYTKWHLQRLFKSQTGMPIGAYIRAKRLDCVATALANTSENIIDISIRYQFDSQQTLCKVFKHRFNMTPSIYRKTLKLKNIREPLA